LREVLADAAKSKLHGTWDVDGDGVENGLDSDFVL
jgi:hypothetical protein